MKKIIYLLSLTLVTALTFSSCTNEEIEEASTEEPVLNGAENLDKNFYKLTQGADMYNFWHMSYTLELAYLFLTILMFYMYMFCYKNI